MKRSVALAVAALATMLSVGVAVATPGTGAVATTLARATFDEIATSHGAGLDAVVQDVTIAPGGHTGWHTHPGGTIILVESGTFTIYNGPEHGKPKAANQCEATVVEAGRGLVEPGGHVQLARNNGTVPLVLTVVYVDVPVGAPVRNDAEAPACAAAAGLPTVATGSGVTAAILSRANFAAGAGIAAADELEVVVQQTTIAPGGHSGWHSHPGATVVSVQAGTLTYYAAADCRKQTFAAGHGLVESGTDVQVGRNDGTVPLVIYTAYFGVPVGGAVRIDQPEPSNCKGLAALPAAVVSAPDTASLAEPGSTSSEPPLAFLLIALAACLLSLGFVRARERS